MRPGLKSMPAMCRGRIWIYLRSEDDRITDVVIVSPKTMPLNPCMQISKLIVHELWETIHHVNAVRLRSLKFNYEPQRYTPAVIDKLAGLNRLTMVSSPAAGNRNSVSGQQTKSIRPHTQATGPPAEQQRYYHLLTTRRCWGRINDTPDAIHESGLRLSRRPALNSTIFMPPVFPSRITGIQGKSGGACTTSWISPHGSDGKAAAERCPAI